MKRFFGFALVVLSLSLPSFAAQKASNISFSTAVKIGSTQVAPGDYKLSWTGTDANVQVTLTQGGKTIVTAAAKLTAAKNGFTSTNTSTVNGAIVLDSILLDKVTLDFSATK